MKKSERNPKSKKLRNCEQVFVQAFVPWATREQLFFVWWTLDHIKLTYKVRQRSLKSAIKPRKENTNPHHKPNPNHIQFSMQAWNVWAITSWKTLIRLTGLKIFAVVAIRPCLHDSRQIFVRIKIRVDRLSVYNETCLSSQIFGNEMSKIMKCIVHK